MLGLVESEVEDLFNPFTWEEDGNCSGKEGSEVDKQDFTLSKEEMENFVASSEDEGLLFFTFHLNVFINKFYFFIFVFCLGFQQEENVSEVNNRTLKREIHEDEFNMGFMSKVDGLLVRSKPFRKYVQESLEEIKVNEREWRESERAWYMRNQQEWKKVEEEIWRRWKSKGERVVDVWEGMGSRLGSIRSNREWFSGGGGWTRNDLVQRCNCSCLKRERLEKWKVFGDR